MSLFTNLDIKSKINKELIQDAFNLSCIVKETLRIDPAGNRSLKYSAYEKTEICGVPIPKGSYVMIALLTTHYNREQYPDPFKFIPERFDPKSSFYRTASANSNDNKNTTNDKSLSNNSFETSIHDASSNSQNSNTRHPLSYIPFSFGCRKCPGMILALIEIKTIIAYLIMKMDYEISEDLLNNPEVRYGIFTNFKLPIKILKKY